MAYDRDSSFPSLPPYIMISKEEEEDYSTRHRRLSRFHFSHSSFFCRMCVGFNLLPLCSIQKPLFFPRCKQTIERRRRKIVRVSSSSSSFCPVCAKRAAKKGGMGWMAVWYSTNCSWLDFKSSNIAYAKGKLESSASNRIFLLDWRIFHFQLQAGGKRRTFFFHSAPSPPLSKATVLKSEEAVQASQQCRKQLERKKSG